MNALPAEDLGTAASLYREAMRDNDAHDKAIWLPTDATTTDENVIIPLVLEAAWKRDIVVFSSNPTHVKRGALFSVYPDNKALGQRLAALALQRAGDPAGGTHTIEPLRDLLIAVNLRTADHLGLEYNSQQLSRFHLVFPGS